MPIPLARADLESLLRDRKLVPPVALDGNTDEYASASTGVAALDARLGGGFPRGQLSEIVGARSSGRASVLLQMLAAATARHEIVALVDVLDMLDVASAAAAGVDLARLLWIRGQLRAAGGGPCRDMNQRALDKVKAITSCWRRETGPGRLRRRGAPHALEGCRSYVAASATHHRGSQTPGCLSVTQPARSAEDGAIEQGGTDRRGGRGGKRNGWRRQSRRPFVQRVRSPCRGYPCARIETGGGRAALNVCLARNRSRERLSLKPLSRLSPKP